MDIFILTFVIFILVIIGLATGVLLRGKVLKGSCGGISALGLEKACDCEEPCDNLKAKIARGEATAEELTRFNKGQDATENASFYEVK